jgi:hypothetical protein
MHLGGNGSGRPSLMNPAVACQSYAVVDAQLGAVQPASENRLGRQLFLNATDRRDAGKWLLVQVASPDRPTLAAAGSALY